MNPFAILEKHYDPFGEAHRILVIHSVLVARKAREIAANLVEKRPGIQVDMDFLTEAALLHDIGIKQCHAPEIGCFGTEPYIRHGVLGRKIVEAEGYPRHALVCARHTGTGITRAEVRMQGLPLPEDDYLPVTIEEKLICAADKFYGKNPEKLWRERKAKGVEKSILKHGAAALERWKVLRDELAMD